MTIRTQTLTRSTLYGVWIFMAATTFISLPLRAQVTGACFDSTTLRAKVYRDAYQNMVSRTDGAGAQERTRLGIPAIPASQVKLVGDTAVCRVASAAYDATLQTGRPLEPVIVLELGDKRAVIKDIGIGDHWLNLIFNQDFTSLLSKFGF
jgi:hypothetical protein